MTGEGWSVMMYIMWDHFNPLLIFIFFFANIYFGVFFVFNLFIAILSDSYIQVRRKANNKEFKEKEAND